ncbi:MAG: hypothetical protein PVH29_11785 [Candidatus Zixiibacteriota bacterium]|jgi:hypothetical protein
MTKITFVTDAHEYHRIDSEGYTLKRLLDLVKDKRRGCTVRLLILEGGMDFYDLFEHIYGENITTMDVCLHGLTASREEYPNEAEWDSVSYKFYRNEFKVNDASRLDMEGFIGGLIENRVELEELVLRSCNQYPDQWGDAFLRYGLAVEVWAPGLAAVGGATTFYTWDPHVPLCQGELLYRLYESRGYLPKLLYWKDY